MAKDDANEGPGEFPPNADPARSTSAEAEQVAALRGEETRATSAEAYQQRELGQSVEPPAGNASIEEWAEYAKARGATDADIEGLGRNELREKYGPS